MCGAIKVHDMLDAPYLKLLKSDKSRRQKGLYMLN